MSIPLEVFSVVFLSSKNQSENVEYPPLAELYPVFKSKKQKIYFCSMSIPPFILLSYFWAQNMKKRIIFLIFLVEYPPSALSYRIFGPSKQKHRFFVDEYPPLSIFGRVFRPKKTKIGRWVSPLLETLSYFWDQINKTWSMSILHGRNSTVILSPKKQNFADFHPNCFTKTVLPTRIFFFLIGGVFFSRIKI